MLHCILSTAYQVLKVGVSHSSLMSHQPSSAYRKVCWWRLDILPSPHIARVSASHISEKPRQRDLIWKKNKRKKKQTRNKKSTLRLCITAVVGCTELPLMLNIGERKLSHVTLVAVVLWHDVHPKGMFYLYAMVRFWRINESVSCWLQHAC